MPETHTHPNLYDRAVATTRAHAIVSLVFGILGVGLGLLIAGFMLVLAFAGSMTEEDFVYTVVYGLCMFLFVVVPHIFLIVSGAVLLRMPRPNVAKGLVIANIVTGALFNLVVLILAIINITQINDYEHGYKKK